MNITAANVHRLHCGAIWDRDVVVVVYEIELRIGELCARFMHSNRASLRIWFLLYMFFPFCSVVRSSLFREKKDVLGFRGCRALFESYNLLSAYFRFASVRCVTVCMYATVCEWKRPSLTRNHLDLSLFIFFSSLELYLRFYSYILMCINIIDIRHTHTKRKMYRIESQHTQGDSWTHTH